ncbi:MAG: protein-L-isoaspartate(D-aspartate) O-methyltransferase [Dehalococcoidales bacterium]|jgi:protein-L-isoaspartate(D-aspartate) O-methyltransferase
MDFKSSRARLIEHLRTEIKDQRVLAVMARVPRERFLPPGSEENAYDDRPLPIGFEQTISQPFIVALMTEALNLSGGEKVLEVGTGSGYQTAILAELAGRVITVERLKILADRASKILTDLGYRNFEVKRAQGEILGWPDEAPYDCILVTAGAPDIPGDLVAQLKVGGRLVIPVGPRSTQQLLRITRGRSRNRVDYLGGCCFVPLIGHQAWQKD